MKKRVTTHGTLSRARLMCIYRRLYRTWGPQHWWPGRTPLEVIVGAILTQNTNWANVERAISRLRQRRLLSLKALGQAPLEQIADAVRPAGYYNQKARRLKSFAEFVSREYRGSLKRMLSEPLERLRQRLLALHGIGPETADSILLYAAGRPVFVIDSYTRRVLRRHGWIKGDEPYEQVAALFLRALPADSKLYNEFHALFVRLGKTHCRTQPHCNGCPLQDLLPPRGPIM